MSIKFKEVAHLYLGCKCEHNCLVDAEDDLPSSQLGRKYSILNYSILSKYEWFNPKPILYKLDSITNKQILEICKLYSPSIFGEYRYSKWDIAPDNNWSNYCKSYEVSNKKSIYSFVIDVIDGDIRLYNDGEIEIAPINQNYRFWYLQHRFDLFGLIESGEAIDAKILNK